MSDLFAVKLTKSMARVYLNMMEDTVKILTIDPYTDISLKNRKCMEEAKENVECIRDMLKEALE